MFRSIIFSPSGASTGISGSVNGKTAYVFENVDNAKKVSEDYVAGNRATLVASGYTVVILDVDSLKIAASTVVPVAAVVWSDSK